MGFLNRLFGTTSRSADSTAETGTRSLEASLYTGDETLEVVGESNYQEALWKIVGARRGDRVRYDVPAVLLPEPDNRFDANAIKVLIDGNLVGYLSRQDAAAYRPGLLDLINESANCLVALDATIVGGGQRPDGPGFLGVFLDHDPADFGIKPARAGDSTGFRTGLSEAVATDLADDGYDLSWYRELSDNDITAIKKLRHMLETDPDPIDRHYMMCELEKRLYKSRDAFDSALDEFDAVCRQHDAEMVTIRPALFEKFGTIPRIDTYRQAAVRCQKAKDWAPMREWAERGINVYGDDSSPEAVEDLHKRLGYATAKIEAANKPKPTKSTKAVVISTTTNTGSGEIESLVCVECGATFERVRTRGRKPHACPTCRGI